MYEIRNVDGTPFCNGLGRTFCECINAVIEYIQFECGGNMMPTVKLNEHANAGGVVVEVGGKPTFLLKVKR
jgi:hypothetical protein